MKRTAGIWALSVALLLPLAWLGASTPLGEGGRSLFAFGGALASAVVFLAVAWRAHLRGAFLPNRCLTCDRPMARVLPGEIRPPSGAGPVTPPTWRCRHCGRLV